MGEASADTRSGWEPRPGVARATRVVAFLLPIVGSVATGFVLTAVLPSPASTAWGVTRWVLVAAVSTAVLIGVERVARRLIPLSILFKLSLAFPDTVPSRLGLALRIGTTMQLRRRIEAASTAKPRETPGEAAVRLLELVGLLSRHDRMTRGHSERVRAYTHVIGTEMGIAGRELDQLRWSALLHDVGKIRVPSEILNKPGRLTDEEFAVVKTHPMAGKACVEPLADWLGESVRAVWEHHERFDGGGYPHGLCGSEIARASRIVCVADAYDVMTSVRSYKQPMSGGAARAELSKHAGTQFDPDVVRAFLNASIGVPVARRRRTSWLSHLALLPRAVVRQVGPSFGSVVAVGTAAALGAVAGSVGLAMAERIPADPVVAPEAIRPDRSTPFDASLPSPSSLASPEPFPTTIDVVDEDAPGPDAQRAAPNASSPPVSRSSSPPPSSTVTTSTIASTVPTTTVPTTTTTVGPAVTVPAVTLPAVTVPAVTVPTVTLPDVTLPVVTLPVVTLPDATAPDVTVPDLGF